MDLRSHISQLEHYKEVKPVKGADWNLEIGAITELIGVACRPFRWKDDFPKVIKVSQELRAKMLNKWRDLF